MTDTANFTITSEFPTPLHSSTLRLSHDENKVNQDVKTEIRKQRKEIMNNMKNPEAKTEPNFVKLKNNHNLMSKNHSDYLEKSEHKIDNGAKPMKLKVVISEINVVNDLAKLQSPVLEKNSIEFTANTKETPTNKQYQRRPIMGRNALLKKANIEPNDSLIIYDLITEKYNSALNHYLDRSAQRRRLKIEPPEDYYSDTVFSTPPGYSPLTVSSISTPSSATPDERYGFRFPNTNDLHEMNEFRYMISTEKIDLIEDKNDEDYLPNDGSPKENYLRFTASADNSNIETTDQSLEDSSTNGASNSNEKSTTSVSDYDPKKFLDNALGEITDFSIACGFRSDICHDNNEKEQKAPNDSVGTSNLSTLLSKASSLCTSTKLHLKKKDSITSATPHSEHARKDIKLCLNSGNTLLDHLMSELSLQSKIMFQVSKALNYCRATKRFESSVELLEAEKILLIASCTKEALTQEIQHIQDETYEKQDDSKSCGEVQFSNLTFYPRHDYKTDAHRDFTDHFLVILTCGRAVSASDVVVAEENGMVNVNKSFNFRNLTADFEISVCIYAMRIGNRTQQNQELRTNCPSPKKILFHLKKSPRKYKVVNDVVYIKQSSFTLLGKCEIRSPDFLKVKHTDNGNILTLKLHNTSVSSLSGTLSMNINTAVKLINGTNGFLTIGTENEHGCTIWSRRWCVLDGPTLKYWNYPSEEGCSPLGSIDLCNCLEQHISFADRSICARPRTLMLPVKHVHSAKKYLLSADSCSDLEKWEREINSVICSLRVWNCMNFL